MKERPILFSDAMVRAILSGAKTQTRRVVKPWQPKASGKPVPADVVVRAGDPPFVYRGTCPYGQPGDRLWVREAFRTSSLYDHIKPSELPVAETETGKTLAVPFWYDADLNGDLSPLHARLRPGKYRPPMFMPRAACRLVLEIVSVRVERLQDISEADAMAEGCAAVEHAQWFEGMKLMADGSRVRQECRGEPPADWTEIRPLSSHDPFSCTAKDAFRRIWYSINGAESWAANPWVWCIEFRRVQP